MKEKQKRLKPEERKAQIVETTKNLILENGLSWASSLRIAKAIGVNQSALYHHFKSKREILLETLSSILTEILQEMMPPRTNEDINEYIRKAARTFYYMTKDDPRQSRLLIEYLCAPPTENLREEVQMIFSGLITNAEALLKEGIAKGDFREDFDSNIIAWVFVSFSTAFSIGSMLEVPKFPSEEQALNAIDIILEAIKK